MSSNATLIIFRYVLVLVVFTEASFYAKSEEPRSRLGEHYTKDLKFFRSNVLRRACKNLME